MDVTYVRAHEGAVKSPCYHWSKGWNAAAPKAGGVVPERINEAEKRSRVPKISSLERADVPRPEAGECVVVLWSREVGGCCGVLRPSRWTNGKGESDRQKMVKGCFVV